MYPRNNILELQIQLIVLDLLWHVVRTDKRGTWAYHSVGRWYPFMSMEHYPTRNWYTKHTKSEQRWLRQIAPRHDEQHQKFSGSTRPPMHHRGHKSPCTGTARPLLGCHNTFHYPQHATSSEGVDTQHATSSKVAVAPKCARNPHW